MAVKDRIWQLYNNSKLFDLLSRGKIILIRDSKYIKHGGEQGMLEYDGINKRWIESEIMVYDLQGLPCAVVTEREVGK